MNGEDMVKKYKKYNSSKLKNKKVNKIIYISTFLILENKTVTWITKYEQLELTEIVNQYHLLDWYFLHVG